MLIDWMTLRFPLTSALGNVLHSRIMANMGHMTKVLPDGSIEWVKGVPDWEAIRSDSLGLYWSVTSNGHFDFLTIGGSPSSQLNQGVNVFGSLSIEQGAKTLIRSAGLALNAILPDWRQWDCRRLDITANYDMGNSAQVKEALRLLLGTDAPRRRTNSDKQGGDSVYWNPTSTLRKGKAYHKGAHLRYQSKKGNIEISDDLHLLADRLLRLELTLGSQWFRRFADKYNWREFTSEFLTAEHTNFFGSLIGGEGLEVSDMGTLLSELEKVAPSKGYALSAHKTWALIKTIGYTQTLESTNKNTFRKHCQFLRAAGLSSADLCAGTVIPFRKKSLLLGSPVLSWHELRKVA